jgi:serine/threonine-protein kinase
MAELSWARPSHPGASSLATGATISLFRRRGCGPKDVAEAGTVTHPSSVPEAYAGMMVTPSVKLLRPLGEGGMGAVWVAEHLALRTEVVVKFIASNLRDSKEATERFSREAAAASQVKSPHVVQTFDHGFTADGIPYIVMELLEGRDLGEYLDQEHRVPTRLVVEIVAQLARALDRAHERGIVHRDIKPGNIFLCDGGRGEVFVKLLDFGIAKGVEMPRLDSATKTGAMIGSPFYMSPEQILGAKNVDHRSDLWSVGVVVFEALTGKKPFDAETMGGLAIRIHSEPLPLPSSLDPSLPPAFDAWFQRACSRPVPDRFASAKEMAEALAAAFGDTIPTSVALPRSSTGMGGPVASRPSPALGIGATTEAGIESPAPPARTRGRLVALAAFALVLLTATFVVVSAARRPGAEKNARTVSAEPAPSPAAVDSVASTPRSKEARPVTEIAPTPTTGAPPAVPSATEELLKPLHPTAISPPPRPHAPTSPPKTSPSARPPLPSATAAPPAPTGHDIF